MNGEHELFGVEHWRPLVLALLSAFAVPPPLLALAPKVGAAMHAGYVEDGNSFKGDAAEVQNDTVTLEKKGRKCESKRTKMIRSSNVTLSPSNSFSFKV